MSLVAKPISLLAFLAVFIAAINLVIPCVCAMDIADGTTASQMDVQDLHDCDHGVDSEKPPAEQDCHAKHCHNGLCGHACQRTLAHSPSPSLKNRVPAFAASHYRLEANQPVSIALDSLYRPPITV